MPSARGSEAQGMSAGTLWSFLAELLMLPTALLTAAFLGRRLDADSYGVYALVVALVNWTQWTIAACFSRTTVKLVSSADDFEPVAASILRFHLFLSVLATVTLWLSAPWLAAWLHSPHLAGYLRIAVLGMPVFCLAQAHRHCLTGLGCYREQAVSRASRWISRLLLIVLLVELGLSLTGVMIALAAATLVEWWVVRRYIQLPWHHPQAVPLGQIGSFAGSVGLAALSLRLHERVDLFAVQALGANLADAGLYSAAQNLTVPWGLLGFAFAPLLLRTLSRNLRDGDVEAARALAATVLRGWLWLIPLAALVAGASAEVATLVYGPRFAGAGVPLAWLMCAGVATMLIAVCVSMLTAADRIGLVTSLTLPLLPLAIVGHALLIPPLGIQGAAVVTALTSAAGALACLVSVYRLWDTYPPAATIGRTVLVAGLAYAASVCWPASGGWLLVKLAAGTLGVGLAFWMIGEFTSEELRQWRERWRPRRPMTNLRKAA